MVPAGVSGGAEVGVRREGEGDRRVGEGTRVGSGVLCSSRLESENVAWVGVLFPASGEVISNDLG